MGSYRTYGILDDQSIDLGDAGFTGVNCRDSADLLAPGVVSDAKNKDFANNTAATRAGLRSAVWAERGGMNFPVDFPYDFDVRMGFGTVQGAGTFSDPYKQEINLIAKRTGTYKIAANQLPVHVPYPYTERVTAPVRFIQCFERILMLRGEDDVPLVWNPQQDFTAGVGSWETITQSDSRNTDDDNSYGDGTVQIPNCSRGCLMGNRVVLIVGRDELIVSDILDYTRYNAATQRFRINAGSDDHIVQIFPYNENTLIVWMNQSIHAIYNFSGDLSNVMADVLTPERGLVSPDAIFPAGKDIGFLSEDGIYTIGQVLDNKLQAIADPLSGPIKKYMDRINWSYASGAVAATHENKTFIAVPMDGAKYNNTILVFDWLKKQWAGYWQADFLDVLTFFKADRSGRKRIFAVNSDNLDTLAYKGAVYLLGVGYTDNIYGDELQISDSVTTRGYTAGALDDKTFISMKLDMSTWNPTYSVAAVPDGVNEDVELRTDVTKDRSKYYVWGKPDYDVTNANDDHAEPDREDYSIDVDADGIYMGANGVDPQLHQRIQDVVDIDVKGHFLQIRMENTQGRAVLHGCTAEVMAGERDAEEKV